MFNQNKSILHAFCLIFSLVLCDCQTRSSHCKSEIIVRHSPNMQDSCTTLDTKEKRIAFLLSNYNSILRIGPDFPISAVMDSLCLSLEDIDEFTDYNPRDNGYYTDEYGQILILIKDKDNMDYVSLDKRTAPINDSSGLIYNKDSVEYNKSIYDFIKGERSTRIARLLNPE